jgi:Tfp pilus assembly pilus retraction ATPase PilT
MSYSILDLMELITKEEGDAVHLHDGNPPVLEIRGELHRLEGRRLEPDEALELFRSIAPRDASVEIKSAGLASFEFLHKNAVFCVMAFREGGNIRVEFRILSQEPRQEPGNN